MYSKSQVNILQVLFICNLLFGAYIYIWKIVISCQSLLLFKKKTVFPSSVNYIKRVWVLMTSSYKSYKGRQEISVNNFQFDYIQSTWQQTLMFIFNFLVFWSHHYYFWSSNTFFVIRKYRATKKRFSITFLGLSRNPILI